MQREAITPLSGSLGLLLVLVITLLGTRSYFPIDETRYLSVAWEMWLRNDFLVPHLNAEPYSHKPPVLFWMIHLGWWLFGVNEWSPRLVMPLFSVGSLLLTVRIGRRLWPEEPEKMALAAPALLASLVWIYFSTAVMFDMLVVFFTLMGANALLSVWQTGRFRGWLWFGAAIGMGILAKGPVILLHTLPPALLAPIWMGEQKRRSWGWWGAGVGVALVLGATIALAWALPAAAAGGSGYANAILWGQTVDRVADALDHQRPFWWYLVGLPLVLLPLILWPGFVRGLAAARHDLQDLGVRVCLTWSLSVLLILSLISAKQVHYLLPVVPPLILLAIHGLRSSTRPDRFLSLALLLVLVGVALVMVPLVARLITVPPNLWWATHLPAVPGWLLMMAGLMVALRRSAWSATERILGMAVGTALVAIAVQISLLSAARPAFDLRQVSLYLQNLEKRGVPLAHFSEYHGQYHFLGRLERPFTVLGGRANVAAWLEEHPAAAAIHYVKPWSPDLRQRHAYAQPYRGGALVVSLGSQVEP